MHTKTKALLDGCKKATHICPKKLGEPMEPFMTAAGAALSQVHGLRLQYAMMTGIEADQRTRVRLTDLDQKLGAIEREARKLMDQAIKVQDIFRQFRETETRIGSELLDVKS